MRYIRPSAAVRHTFEDKQPCTLFNGSCEELLAQVPDESVQLTVSSPPYCMGKEYEPGNKIEDFIAAHEAILPEVVRVTKQGGSVCWQVGYHVTKNIVTPLDYIVLEIVK